MDEYPNNSDAYRNKTTLRGELRPAGEEEKVEVAPIVAEPAMVKKKSKFGRIFIKEDLGSVGRYILQDILIPALKKTFVSMINNGTNMMVYGEGRNDYSDRDYRRGRSSVYDYYDDRDRDLDYRTKRRNSAPTYSYDEVVWPDYNRAVEARRCMREELRERGKVTVAYLYQLAHWNYDYTAEHYGWRNLDYAEIAETKGGYWLKLPRATEL